MKLKFPKTLIAMILLVAISGTSVANDNVKDLKAKNR